MRNLLYDLGFVLQEGKNLGEDVLVGRNLGCINSFSINGKLATSQSHFKINLSFGLSYLWGSTQLNNGSNLIVSNLQLSIVKNI